MSIQEPAWRKRTRPCPFFSQGRCLFADSCNFLHDIKVKSAVDQSLLDATLVKQPSSLPPKHVFHPPSLVVNSASPRTVNLTSPIHDTSRYSGLLSVLSDVIGPTLFPLDEENASSDLQEEGDATLNFQDTTYDDSVLLPGSDSTLVGLSSDDIESLKPHLLEMDEPVIGHVDEMSPARPLDDERPPFPGGQMPGQQLSPPGATNDAVDDGDPFAADAPSYLVDDEAYIAASTPSYIVEDDEGCGGGMRGMLYQAEEEEEEGEDVTGLDEPTIMAPQRQSVLSTFTGASLLASPRNSLFEEASAESPTQPGSPNLLSPVQMSARLRPFSLHSFDGNFKRGDSIDSGYADGDSWVSPLPFPRSPPRSARSSMSFAPSHSRRMSLVSPTTHERRVSYDVRAIRPSPHMTVETIEEHASEEGSEKSDDDDACSIFGAYDTSTTSGELREIEEDLPSPTLRLSDAVPVERIVEESDEAADSVVIPCSPPPGSPERLHQTVEYSNADFFGQHSFVSDDNASFKTALSAQPSFEDLSDVSARVSPVKQDSLLSYISGRSTPNTSLQSHDGDTSELFGQETVGPYRCDSPHLAETAAPKEQMTLEEDIHESWSDSPLSSVATSDSNASWPKLSPSLASPHQSYTAQAGVTHKPWSQSSLHAAPTADSDFPVELSPQASPKITDSQGPDDVCAEDNADYSLSAAYVGFESAPELPVQEDRSSAAEDVSCSQEDPDSFESECCSFSAVSPLQFPLPPTFIPADLVGHSTLCDDEDAAVRSDEDASVHSDESAFAHSDVEASPYSDEETSTQSDESMSSRSDTDNLEAMEDVTCAWPPSMQSDDTQRARSVSDLTVKACPSDLAVDLPQQSGSTTEFVLQRNRAASDLTIKGSSSSSHTMVLKPSSPAVHQEPSRSDSVQSLYDHYLDDEPSPGDPGLSAHSDGDIDFPSSLRHAEEYPPDGEASQHHFPGPSVVVFHRPPSQSSAAPSPSLVSDSPCSEAVLRPLLTGRRSLLDSSLAELAPQLSPAESSRSISASMPSSTRLQTKEIGSTMVPFGFRRLNPQFAARRSLRIVSQPVHSAPPAIELREALRIRTDIAQQASPPRCFSAAPILSSDQVLSPSLSQSHSAPPTSGLKPLRLSSALNSKRSSSLSTHSSSIMSSIVSPVDHIFNSSTPQSPSVSSSTSLSRNSLLSSTCQPIIPEHTRNTTTPSDRITPFSPASDNSHFPSQFSSTRRDSRSISAPIQQPKSWRLSHYRAGSRNYSPTDVTRRMSRRISTLSLSYVVDEEEENEDDDPTISHPVQSNLEDDWTRPASALAAPVHAIATPKPTLLFAIASDDVEQVRQVLESGEAGPNDPVGPQSALAFTLTNDKLAHKNEIVKALLAYGANPSALQNPALNPAARPEADGQPSGPPLETTFEGMDPATRYFVARADAGHTRQTSQLIYRSFFRPLTRVRYDVIGQDWALEQLFRVLSMHSQKLAVAPIVVLLCGPSGHGKSLLARKFGSLLDVPTHTVNMTTLRSTHDIWQSYSMSPYEEPSSCTLAQFLLENEGKRCVVVLDEIEKVEDQKALWSLLMPWELGRCSLEAGTRHIDVRKVIWLGTSNIGHELVFEHHQDRAEPDKQMTREEYLKLTDILRPRVSNCLGASLLSRVTTVLPFVPFTQDEKKAIAAEAVFTLAGEAARAMSPQDVESLVIKALPSYHPGEGARSLHRAVSNQLVDAI